MTDDTGETGRDDRDQRNLGSILTVGKLQEISPEVSQSIPALSTTVFTTNRNSNALD